MKRTITRAAIIGASAMLCCPGVAYANPATPMPEIESSASQLCSAINGNSTAGGVVDGLNGLAVRGLDEIDSALVLLTAVHHVCPQREELIMAAVNPVAAEELCTKSQ